jgi:glycosyltransferase involved in cell wall biosynthesis
VSSVTILVPCYNESKTIIQLLKQVNDQNFDTISMEVIVVNDGSSDNTLELLKANPNLYTKLVNMPQNGGKGAAVKAGLKEATGKYILFQDADLEYDPRDYKLLFEVALDYDADVIYGSRFLAPKKTRVAYFWNKVGNRLITLFFNILNNTTFTDIYSCYLMYKRELIDPDELKTFGWEQQAEILSLSIQRGKVFYEVPISYYGRSHEEGKKIRAYHIIGVFKTILFKRFF